MAVKTPGMVSVPVVLSLLLASLALLPAAPAAQAAPTLPSGFTDTAVITNLTKPTVVQFASDGRVFVAEKSGLVKVYESLTDPSPTIFADLRTQVHNFWDRGLLGCALHPSFPVNPSAHVLYTHDAAVGGVAPRWGAPGVTDDPCPTPPGATADGRVVSGRLSRLTAGGNTSTGETVLIEDWCQQYPSHSIGSLVFGPDGALYASAGDGASFNFTDWGQDGSLAHGLRNPFRMTVRPGTGELWSGDVGRGSWEEIDRLTATGAPVENYGWPCYEGVGRQGNDDGANLNLCENLYSEGTGAVVAPHHTYQHGQPTYAGDTCRPG